MSRLNLPLEALTIRPFCEGDDIVALNALLKAAYAPLAEAGMRYAASFEDVEATRRQVAAGNCYLGILNDQIVACVVLRLKGGPTSPAFYHQSGVSNFGRFAVNPDLQGMGFGSKVMDYLENIARESGFSELALDTSERAVHLIQMYEDRGYRFIGHHQWSHTNYRSVVMSKCLSP